MESPKKRRKRRPPLLTTNITSGMDEDLEIFVYKVFEEFEKKAGPRFSIFTSEWRKSSFGLIFCGRESFRDMFEFSEELFLRVKKYAMTEIRGKPNHTLVRYVGLYLMYSLFFKQPCRPRVKFRIKKDEFKQMLSLTEQAKADNHWDVMYAWSKLFTNYAFYYVVCDTQMGIEMSYQSDQRETAEKNIAAANHEYFKTKQFEGLLHKVSKAHIKYVTMKKSLVSSKSKGDEIDIIDSDFPKTLRETSATNDKEEIVKKAKEKSKLGETRRGLKYKFFALGGIDEDE